ncbi:MAG: DUF4365 domain-containing protein [Candidatus Nanoarchaeia archaeon]|nr:DUF4365 domain-containing protein [Candidatus Nanoarchaeia archaeon]
MMPKYTDNKRKGNIGEAFIQYILSNFCLVHKIDGGQDLGNDFVCELIKKEYPTNILFYIQVKYWDKEPKDKDVEDKFEYWKSSQIPVYLFWIDSRDILQLNFHDNSMQKVKYKRYTPITHGSTEDKFKKFESFSKINFLRDLMVDYARCLYIRGLSTVIIRNDFSEEIKLANNCFFVNDLIKNEYKDKFIKNSWTNLLAAAKSLHASKQNDKKYLELDKKYLELALEHIVLARKMINLTQSQFSSSFKDKIIPELEKEIRNDLNKLEFK